MIFRSSQIDVRSKPKKHFQRLTMVNVVWQNIGMYSLRQMLLRHQIGKIKNGKQILVNLENRAGGKTVSPTGDQIANAVYDYGHGNPPDYEEYDKDAWEYAVQLYHTIQEEDISLSDYYAMLKFDGDNMGEIFLNKHTVKEQQELSRSISDFASEIPNVLKELMDFWFMQEGRISSVFYHWIHCWRVWISCKNYFRRG